MGKAHASRPELKIFEGVRFGYWPRHEIEKERFIAGKQLSQKMWFKEIEKQAFIKTGFFDLSKTEKDSDAPPAPSRRRTMTWILQRLMAAYLRLLEAAQDANGIRQVPTVAIALPG